MVDIQFGRKSKINRILKCVYFNYLFNILFYLIGTLLINTIEIR